MAESKAIKVKDKQELAVPAEHTDSGLVFAPEVDIFETEREIRLLVDMPGVPADGLDINLQDRILTLFRTAPHYPPTTQASDHESSRRQFYRAKADRRCLRGDP